MSGSVSSPINVDFEPAPEFLPHLGPNVRTEKWAKLVLALVRLARQRFPKFNSALPSIQETLVEDALRESGGSVWQAYVAIKDLMTEVTTALVPDRGSALIATPP